MERNARTILVTGATSGIGYATSRRLAAAGHRVRIVGRDPDRGERAARTLTAETGGQVEFLGADLSSRDAVRDLAAQVRERDEPLDVLLNNVGGLYADRWVTVDGVEATLAMNHLNPLLLTHLLLDELRAAAPSRVVFVNSGAHRWAKLRDDDPQAERFYRGLDTYGTAKLRSLLAAMALARRLDGSGVTVTIADPGGALTDMTSAMEPRMAPPWMRPIWPLFRWFQSRQSIEGATRSSVALAGDPRFDGVTGAYVSPKGTVGRAVRSAEDHALTDRIYLDAVRELGLDPVGAAAAA